MVLVEVDVVVGTGRVVVVVGRGLVVVVVGLWCRTGAAFFLGARGFTRLVVTTAVECQRTRVPAAGVWRSA